MDRAGAVRRNVGGGDVLGAFAKALVRPGDRRRSRPELVGKIVGYVNEGLGGLRRFLQSPRMPGRASNHFVAVVCTALALTCVQVAGAQTMYRYKDANGVWVYTDRKPAAE